MNETELLMIPGPTNTDPRVLRALSKPPLSHTGAEFAGIFRESLEDLKKIYMTKSQVFAIAGSGTLALEIAVANAIEPGDKILNCVSGFFGQYFTKMSGPHGAKSKVLEVPWGQSITPEMVRDALSEDHYKAVTVTHVDTSTGVCNPIREIGKVVRENSDAFYIVDTVCSLGGMEVRVDDWNIDFCVSGSQKCLGVPPGLALLSVSGKALKYLETRKPPVGFWYGDLKNWLPIMIDPSKYFATPAVNMIYALREALRLVLDEGMETRFKRHHILAEAFRNAMKFLNVKIVAKEECAADTVTACYYPERIDDGAFRTDMKRRGIVVAPTIGLLKGKGFRVGHLGNVGQNEIFSTVGAIEATLGRLGAAVEYGVGSRAVLEKIGFL